MEYARSSELEEKDGMPEHMVPHFKDPLQVTTDFCVAVLDKHRMDIKKPQSTAVLYVYF